MLYDFFSSILTLGSNSPNCIFDDFKAKYMSKVRINVNKNFYAKCLDD